MILLAAVLPRVLGPSALDEPAPGQTAEPSKAPESAQPTQAVSSDPGVDCLAHVMETVEWLRLDNMEVDEAELYAALAQEARDKPIVIDADIDFSI